MFLLATTALTMLLAAQIRPGAAAPAGVLVGWNPLLQFETAGNAHNDVVMVFFALAALYAVARRWWLAVFPLLALSIASKHVLVVLGPVLLVWLLRRSDLPRSRIALSLALGALVGAAVYAPFFAGMATLNGFRQEADRVTSSPGALIDTLLWARLDMDPIESRQTVTMVLGSLYLILYAVLLVRVRRNADVIALVRTGFWVVFLLLLIAKWWFWPWYLLWLVPLGALLPESRPALIAAVFSATAMLMYVPYNWLLETGGIPLAAATALTAFLLPSLLALTPKGRQQATGNSRESPVAVRHVLPWR